MNRTLRNTLIITAFLITLTGRIYFVAAGLTVILLIALTSDRKVMRRIGKPQFWIFSAVAIALAGLLLGKNPHQISGISLSVEGFTAGLLMSARAFTLILGFVLLSRTIDQERFLYITQKIGLPHYVPAFQTALETLPQMKQAFAESKRGGGFIRMESLIDFILLAKNLAYSPPLKSVKVYGVTGDRNSGKTTFLRTLAKAAAKTNVPIGGFVQDRFTDGAGGRFGYKIASLTSGDSRIIAERKDSHPFRFNSEAFESAAEWLKKDVANSQILIIDELGVLEAKGEGHLPALLSAMPLYPDKIWIVAFRKDRLDSFRDLFDLTDANLIDLDMDGGERDGFVRKILGD